MYYSIILIILQNLQDMFYMILTSLLLLFFYYKPKMIIEIDNILDFINKEIVSINKFNILKKKNNAF